MEEIVYPSWDCLPYSNISPRKEIISRRYRAIREAKRESQKCKIFLLSVDSILQKIVPTKEMLEYDFSLTCDQEVEIEKPS